MLQRLLSKKTRIQYRYADLQCLRAENEASDWEKAWETDQQVHRNQASIRFNQDKNRLKRFL
jgi:hypothetical protein